jgi:pectin lyase
MTSGRTPALSGNTLFHAVNNVWSTNSGHLLEGDKNGMGLYEGNYFTNVPTVVQPGSSIRLFSSNSADVSKCSQYLGRNCVSNSLSSSGAFSYSDTSFLSLFKGKTNIASAAAVSSIQNTVPASAGNTL